MYEKIKIGDEFEDVTHEITLDMVKKYLEAIDEDLPVDNEGEVKADFIVPPTIISVFMKDAMNPIIMPGMVHAKQEFAFRDPMKINDTFTTSTSVTDKFLKKERKWLILEMVTKNSSGEVAAISRASAIFP